MGCFAQQRTRTASHPSMRHLPHGSERKNFRPPVVSMLGSQSLQAGVPPRRHFWSMHLSEARSLSLSSPLGISGPASSYRLQSQKSEPLGPHPFHGFWAHVAIDRNHFFWLPPLHA